MEASLVPSLHSLWRDGDGDVAAVVSLLRRVSAVIADPSAQKALRNASGDAVIVETGLRGSLSPVRVEGGQGSELARTLSNSSNFSSLCSGIALWLGAGQEKIVEAALAAAAEALAHLSWPRASPELSDATSSDASVSKVQADEVRRLLDAALRCLSFERLRRGVRLCLSAASARYGPQTPVDALLRFISEHTDVSDRHYALLSIIPLLQPRGCDDSIVLPLLSTVCPLLRDDDPDTVVAVEKVLGHLRRIDPNFSKHTKKLDYALQQYLTPHMDAIRKWSDASVGAGAGLVSPSLSFGGGRDSPPLPTASAAALGVVETRPPTATKASPSSATTGSSLSPSGDATPGMGGTPYIASMQASSSGKTPSGSRVGSASSSTASNIANGGLTAASSSGGGGGGGATKFHSMKPGADSRGIAVRIGRELADSSEEDDDDAGAAEEERVLGVLPPSLLKQLTDDQGKWCARPAAVDELAVVIGRLDSNGAAALSPHLEALFRMLAGLLKDTQFKTIMTLVKAVETVVELCKERVAPVVNVLLPSLFEKLGDNKIVVRQASLRCLGLLMRHVDKNPALLASIFSFFQHRNRHLRESAIKALIVGLIHGSIDVNVAQIVGAVFPLLGDGTIKIRLAAIEALALLQNVTTDDADVIELLEQHHVAPDHIGAVLARLHATHQALPRINSMGILELSYETAAGSVGGTFDGDGPTGLSLPDRGPSSMSHVGGLPSPPVPDTMPSSAMRDEPSGFWTEDSTEASVGASRNRAPSASMVKDPRSKIPFEIPRAARPRSQIKQLDAAAGSAVSGVTTPTTGSDPGASFTFSSPREDPEPSSVRKYSSLSDYGGFPPSASTGAAKRAGIPESRTPQPAKPSSFEARVANGARLAAAGGRPLARSDVGIAGEGDLPLFRDDLSLMIAPDDNAAVLPSFHPSVGAGRGAHTNAHATGPMSAPPESSDPAMLFTSSMKRGEARVRVPAATPLLIEPAGQSPSPTSTHGGMSVAGSSGHSLFPAMMRGNSGDSDASFGEGGRKPSHAGVVARRDGSPLHPSSNHSDSNASGLRAQFASADRDREREVTRSLGAAPPRSTRRTSPELPPTHDPVSLSVGAMPSSGSGGVLPGDSPPDSRSYVLGTDMFSRGRRRRTTHNTPDERSTNNGEYDSPKPPQRPYILGNGPSSSRRDIPLSGRMSRNVSFDVPGDDEKSGGDGGDSSIPVPSSVYGNTTTQPPQLPVALPASGRSVQPRTSSALVTRTELELRQDRFIVNAYEDEPAEQVAYAGRASPDITSSGVRMHSQLAGIKDSLKGRRVLSASSRGQKPSLAAGDDGRSGSRSPRMSEDGSSIPPAAHSAKDYGRRDSSDFEDEPHFFPDRAAAHRGVSGDTGRPRAGTGSSALMGDDRPIRPMEKAVYYDEDGRDASPYDERGTPDRPPAKHKVGHPHLTRLLSTASDSSPASDPPSTVSSSRFDDDDVASGLGDRDSTKGSSFGSHHSGIVRGARSAAASRLAGGTTKLQPHASVPAKEEEPRSKAQAIEALAKHGGDAVYTDSASLERPSHPEKEFREAMDDLRNADWAHQFAGMDVIRAVALHAPEVIAGNPGTLHALVLQMEQLAKSLRSSVSRNAMMTFADLFAGLGKAMDPELEPCATILMARVVDVSGFLGESAEKAMASMIHNCSDSRVIAALSTQAGHKNANIRAKAAVWLDRCVAHMGPRVNALKELQRVVNLACNFIEDAKEESRKAGKMILVRLYRAGAIDERYLERNLDGRRLAGARDALVKGFSDAELASAAGLRGVAAEGGVAGPGSGHVSPARAKSGRKTSASSSRASAEPKTPLPSDRDSVSVADSVGEHAAGGAGRPSRRPRQDSASGGGGGGGSGVSSSKTTSPQSADELRSLQEQLNSNEFRTRRAAVEELASFCERDRLAATSQALVISDELARRIGDSNAKVSLAALSLCRRVITAVKDGIDGCHGVLVPALVPHLAGTKDVAAAAVGALECLASLAAKPQLLMAAYITALPQHRTNSKLQAAIVERITGIMGITHPKKADCLRRTVLPALFGLLDVAKTDVRAAVSLALQLAVRYVGKDGVMEAAATLPEDRRAKVKAVVDSSR